MNDFEQLDSLHNAMANRHVSVVGGGFLGTIMHDGRLLMGVLGRRGLDLHQCTGD